MSSSSVLLTISLLIVGTLHGNSPIETHGSPIDLLSKAGSAVGSGVKGIAQISATATGLGIEGFGKGVGAVLDGTHGVIKGTADTLHAVFSASEGILHKSGKFITDGIASTGSYVKNIGRNE